ncbi:SGNH/GDSL hydrolase family protein [Microbacterium sp. NPDC076911]|uniref:SGNH/GDSL hydrolase family protein n=1 Tax=Microbacterium sp. NPDC076911 TaxID=3154958 RepID=UPI00341E58FC
MTPHPKARVSRPWWAVIAVGFALAVVCATTLWRPWLQTSAPVAGAESQPVGTTAEALVLPTSPRVLVFGDSWVYGSAAIVPELGFAYRLGADLGWEVRVDGVRGSGYLKPGIDGPAYGTRFEAMDAALSPDLIIVQGSINDRRLYEPAAYQGAVNAAWDELAAKYPAASIVILGPAPQVLPIEAATEQIDQELATLAAERGWWYISPIAESWIIAANYLDVIDTGAGRDHPSTEGHAYLAERVMTALGEIIAPTEVVADAPEDAEPIISP